MMKTEMQTKIEWSGTVFSVQPRSKVWRYKTDNRTHSLCGYNLFLDGIANGKNGRFSVAISEKQQQKLLFRIGDDICGIAWTKLKSFSDYADLYRASSLKILKRAIQIESSAPPFLLIPPNVFCVMR